MTLSNVAETEILSLLFLNEAYANIGNAGGLLPSTVDGSFTIALHTGDPGEAGDQTTNEADYTSYVRLTVNRGTGEWSVSGNEATNDNILSFVAATGGDNDITHFSIGTGVGDAIVVSGALTATLNVTNGITPNFTAGELDITAD